MLCNFQEFCLHIAGEKMVGAWAGCLPRASVGYPQGWSRSSFPLGTADVQACRGVLKHTRS